MNKLISILTFILIVVFVLTMQIFTSFAKDWSNRVENNYTVDGNHWGLGSRSYMNYGTSHVILRYNFNNHWASQYRYVTKNDGEIEHWFRLQHKDFKMRAFFFYSRIEYRIKESTDDIFRVRPLQQLPEKFFENEVEISNLDLLGTTLGQENCFNCG